MAVPGWRAVRGKVLHYHGLPPHPHAHTHTPTNLPYPPLTQDPPTPALTEAEETKGHKVKKTTQNGTPVYTCVVITLYRHSLPPNKSGRPVSHTSSPMTRDTQPPSAKHSALSTYPPPLQAACKYPPTPLIPHHSTQPPTIPPTCPPSHPPRGFS
ncbi:extensin-like [Portunus trituberculatus]|uniref:extensin-like n=1 Tax=Portunus trituberculatus TaxID=210409 RepID=UPI001E1CBFF7|nr:extensin-like [Portunus trituberculatus]